VAPSNSTDRSTDRPLLFLLQVLAMVPARRIVSEYFPLLPQSRGRVSFSVPTVPTSVASQRSWLLVEFHFRFRSLIPSLPMFWLLLHWRRQRVVRFAPHSPNHADVPVIPAMTDRSPLRYFFSFLP